MAGSLTAAPLGEIPTAVARPGSRVVAVWLLIVCGLIFAMVVVGGITRLTLSGLSITQWNPVIGVVPPLTHAQWVNEFQRYQQVPEYRALHYGMSLTDFKTIFFWEYTHRLLGRLIGLAFAAPLLWFWLRGRLPRGLGPPLLGILVLGFAQGLLGWYMVESGLVHRVEVSQYRLVAHLALALAIYSLILWTALSLLGNPARGSSARMRPSPPFRDNSINPSPSMGEGREGVNTPVTSKRRNEQRPAPITSSPGEEPRGRITPAPTRPHQEGGNALRIYKCPSLGGRHEAFLWRRWSEAVIALVGLTIAAGGFVAGTRAGLTYNTFPLMDGHFVPSGYARLQPFVRNWFENIPAVQFDHRLLAETSFAVVLVLWAFGLHRLRARPARIALWSLLAAVLIQATLGISTLLLVVPIPLAAAHQAGAVLLLTAAITFRHTLRSAALMDASAAATI